MNYKLNAKMGVSLIVTTLIVSGLAYAATTITNTSQNVVNNDIISAAWYNDVNDKLTNITTGLTNISRGTSDALLKYNATGDAVTNSQVYENAGNVGIGVASPSSKLTVSWTIESTTGWFKFPDGTVQTTAKNRAIDDVTLTTSCPTGQCDFSAGGYSNTTSVNLTKGIYLVTGYACSGQQGVNASQWIGVSIVFLSGSGWGHSTWTDFNNSRATCGDSIEPIVLRVRSDVATVAVRLSNYNWNSFWVLPTAQNTIYFNFQSLWK